MIDIKNHTWRKDIDGLRALAVIAVIAFHLRFTHYKIGGGWLGVDIFFVISGFLITPLLLKAQNFWDFVEFWGRRARRIFPSLILTLILVMGLGYVYLLPDEFSKLGSEATFGSIFSANIYYLSKIGEYFENQRGSNFLLNLWSLGVEEQYYIIFPFIIWGLRRYKSTVILMIIVSLAVISWLAQFYTAIYDQSSAFYLPYTRFWEIMVGSALAVLCANKPYFLPKSPLIIKDIWQKPLKIWWQYGIIEILCIASLIIILWAIGKSPIDSSGLLRLMPDNIAWQTLPIVIAAAILIYFGANSFIYQKIMGFPVLRYIGLISFPIYLLHWPLYKFNELFKISTDLSKWILLTVTILLSAGFYHFAEKPIRKIPAKLVLIPGLAGLLILAGVSYLFSQNKISTASIIWQDNEQKLLLKSADNALTPQNYLEGYHPEFVENIIVFQNHPAQDKLTIFFGNSHAYMMGPRFLNSDQNIGFLVGIGCGFFIIAHNSDDCKKFNKNSEILASSPRVSTIIIAYHWQYYDTRLTGPDLEGRPFVILNHGVERPFTASDRELVFKAQADFIKKHIAQGKKIVLVGSPPLNIGFIPKSPEFLKRDWLSLPKLINQTWVPGQVNEDPPADQTFTRQRLIKLAKDTGAKYIDPVNYQCRADAEHQEKFLQGFTPDYYECRRLTDDGEFTHSDYSHYSVPYAKNAAWMDEIIK